jgi:SAM-dependent methyltransferase
MAAQNLEALDCEVDLEQADFVEAIRNRPDPADVVWFGLSLHHLETSDKREIKREIHEAMAEGGRFLIFEPAMRQGESREAWLDRIEKIIRTRWTALSTDEHDTLVQHIRKCDLPETVSGWQALGREAGFREARLLFRPPDDLFAVICFDK